MTSESSTAPTDNPQDLFFTKLRALHPDAELRDIIIRVEKEMANGAQADNRLAKFARTHRAKTIRLKKKIS